MSTPQSEYHSKMTYNRYTKGETTYEKWKQGNEEQMQPMEAVGLIWKLKEDVDVPVPVWEVEYPSWDGTLRLGYTSREACAEECSTEFGWYVRDSPEPRKKSCTLELDTTSPLARNETFNTEVGAFPYCLEMREWINADRTEYGVYREDWTTVYITRGCK